MYEKAKKLINDFLKNKKKIKDYNSNNLWNELLLDIAQKENDFSAIQKLSYSFIKENFNKKYYEIYKASFEPAKWLEKREKLFQHYCSEQYFNDSAGNLLKAAMSLIKKFRITYDKRSLML